MSKIIKKSTETGIGKKVTSEGAMFSLLFSLCRFGAVWQQCSARGKTGC